MKLTPHVSLIERLSRGRLTPLKGTKTTGIVSPWSDGKLDSLVWTDILGIDHAPVTRSEAMSVPAIAAARNRIVQLADRPLRGLDASGDVTPTLPWLFRTDVDETAWERTARILDDWIFYPWSLLLVAREGEIMAGTKFQQIADAQHVPYDRWAIDDEGRMTVDGNVIPEGDTCSCAARSTVSSPWRATRFARRSRSSGRGRPASGTPPRRSSSRRKKRDLSPRRKQRPMSRPCPTRRGILTVR